jgi:transposase
VSPQRATAHYWNLNISQGYWLAQKRLSKGRFVWWPEATGPTKPLEAYEAQLLMAAGDLSRVRAAPM